MYFKCLLIAFVISYYPIVLAAALERERSTQARAERACQRRDKIKNGKDIPLPNSTSSLSSSFTVIPVLQEHTLNLQPPLQQVYAGLSLRYWHYAHHYPSSFSTSSICTGVVIAFAS